MIDDVVRHGHDFAPDVVLFEASALAGPLAAEILGLLAVAHMFGPLSPNASRIAERRYHGWSVCRVAHGHSASIT